MFRFYTEPEIDLNNHLANLELFLLTMADRDLFTMTQQIYTHGKKLAQLVQEYRQKCSTDSSREALHLLSTAADHYLEVQNKVLVLLNTTPWVEPGLPIKILEDSQNKLQAAFNAYHDSVTLLEPRKKFRKNLFFGALSVLAGFILFVGGILLVGAFPPWGGLIGSFAASLFSPLAWALGINLLVDACYAYSLIKVEKQKIRSGEKETVSINDKLGQAYKTRQEYEQGMNLLRSNHLEQGVDHLRKIPKESTLYKHAMYECGNAIYAAGGLNKQWAPFFKEAGDPGPIEWTPELIHRSSQLKPSKDR